MVGLVTMGHRGSVDVAANEASLWDNTTEQSEFERLTEQLMRPEWAQLRREWKWAVTEQRARGTEDGVESARQSAEGEGSKEGADLLRGGQGGGRTRMRVPLRMGRRAERQLGVA